jgi:hypothetical protein
MSNPLVARITTIIGTDVPEDQLLEELKEAVAAIAPIVDRLMPSAKAGFTTASINDMTAKDALLLLLGHDASKEAGLKEGEVVDGVELRNRIRMHLGERES